MITLKCAACGALAQLERPNPQLAVELAAWALEVGWHPRCGCSRAGSFVRLFCSLRCADANLTKQGTLRIRPVKVLPEGPLLADMQEKKSCSES